MDVGKFPGYAARLVRAGSLSELTKHLEFEAQGVPRFGFVPGQWLSVKANTPEGEEITRAYSIASPPSANGHFAFCLNRVRDGFMSNHLCDLEEGSEISFQGPFGAFTLRAPLADTVFISTGTGVAPFRSMLHWLFAEPGRSQGRAFWLFFGARYESDLYYRAEFEELAARNSDFHYLPTLSRPAETWQGLHGYVQEHLPPLVAQRTDMHAYICGLDKMVRANRDLLLSLGWDRRSVRHEKYD